MDVRIGEPLFSVNHLRHRYAAREILTDVTLTVHQGDRLGLLGVNGAGKTTLLKIMAGVEKPDGGEIAQKRGLQVGYLPQDFALTDNKTVLESIREGVAETRALMAHYQELSEKLSQTHEGPEAEAMLTEQAALSETLEHRGAWDLDRLIETVSQHLRTPPADRIINTLSGGERRRVSLARTLVAQPDLLILDEPTNHLDADSITWLEDFLANYRGSSMLVTHDRYFLDRVVNRMVELENGVVKTYNGNYSDYLEAKAHELESATQQEHVRQMTLRRELAWVRKQPQGRQAKSKAREDAYYALADQAGGPNLDEMRMRIPTGDIRLGKKIVVLDRVSKAFHGKILFKDLNLNLAPGDRIGVVGPNGLGKTTLMRMIQGMEPADSGTIEIGPNTRFVYADQGRDRLNTDKTLVEEVADSAQFITVEGEQMTVRSYLRRFLFSDDQQTTPVGKFSGGEQNRAQLAKLLAKGGNLLILDEPTNDLDLQTLRALEEALVEYSGCAFVVSHDRYFLNRVATAILAFEGDGKVTYSVGSYNDYLAQQERLAAAAAEVAVPVMKAAPVTASDPTKNAVRKLTYKETKELEGMEAAIEAGELRVAELEAQLGDPALYADRSGDVAGLTAELAQARTAVEGLYARWEELEAIRQGSTSPV